MACSATLPNFYLPPRCETLTLDVNISLNMANLYMIDILAQDFCILKHLGNNGSDVQLLHLTSISLIPVHKIYQHLLNDTLPIMPFDMDKESTELTSFIWTLFSHTGIYVTAIGSFIPVGLGLFCCYFFWCQPARLVCQPLQPGNMQYTIVDDNVEVPSHSACVLQITGQWQSTDMMARQPNPQDLVRIMAWLWSIYLHGWRVDVSNSCSHW